MTSATLARVSLAAMMLVLIGISVWRHGKQVRSFRFDARWPIIAVINEAVLIWLAGGFGGSNDPCNG